MFHATYKNSNTYLETDGCFDPAQTLDCGQAFRWQNDGGLWRGVAMGRLLTLRREGNTVVLYDTDEETFQTVWRNYFDLDRDYPAVQTAIGGDAILQRAGRFGRGIRILNQEPWETLCSFIISQNNNIPRIKGIIERLCTQFGERRDGYFCFPAPERIASLTVEDLAPLRCGFRAKYILDAAQKVACGHISLQTLRQLPCAQARESLMQIKGVGPKVADCTLLFGLGHIEAFPQDVWIKRTMQALFGGTLPECALPYAGIVQQYLFFYARTEKFTPSDS